jgi:hypothetical protein
METFDDGIKIVKYFIEEIDDYKIHVYYNDFDEKKLDAEMLNDLKLPENKYYLKDPFVGFAGNDNSIHIFFERTRYYGINVDGSAHHFRVGVLLPEKVTSFMFNKYKNFKLMDNKRLESGLQNKVFYIELILKDVIKASKF